MFHTHLGIKHFFRHWMIMIKIGHFKKAVQLETLELGRKWRALKRRFRERNKPPCPPCDPDDEILKLSAKGAT